MSRHYGYHEAGPDGSRMSHCDDCHTAGNDGVSQAFNLRPVRPIPKLSTCGTELWVATPGGAVKGYTVAVYCTVYRRVYQVYVVSGVCGNGGIM